MRFRNNRAFTLLELILVVALVAIIGSVAYPSYRSHIENTMIGTAITDITKIDLEIATFYARGGTFPNSLSDLGTVPTDPWGNPYQYLNITTAKGKGSVRKDKNLVPINSDYDLYSMGKDGASQPPLPAAPSRDDIVRANNGGFLGLAEDY